VTCPAAPLDLAPADRNGAPGSTSSVGGQRLMDYLKEKTDCGPQGLLGKQDGGCRRRCRTLPGSRSVPGGSGTARWEAAARLADPAIGAAGKLRPRAGTDSLELGELAKQRGAGREGAGSAGMYRGAKAPSGLVYATDAKVTGGPQLRCRGRVSGKTKPSANRLSAA